MSRNKLSAQAVYLLNEAIIRLHDAARHSEPPVSDEIREIADEVEAIKEWGSEA